MGYKFRTGLHIEYPFFVEMSNKLNGVKRRDNFNGKETYRCVCPRCGKHKAVMGYARTGDTFILACPVEGCDLGGMTLHDLIKRYGGESMFQRWRKAWWKTNYTEDWLPIMNRKRSKSSGSEDGFHSNHLCDVVPCERSSLRILEPCEMCALRAPTTAPIKHVEQLALQKHELLLLYAFGRSEGLFGSPPRCRYN